MVDAKTKVAPKPPTAKTGEAELLPAIGIYRPPVGGWALETLVGGELTETIYPTRAEAEEAEYVPPEIPLTQSSTRASK
jgi:hypothetical protein